MNLDLEHRDFHIVVDDLDETIVLRGDFADAVADWKWNGDLSAEVCFRHPTGCRTLILPRSLVKAISDAEQGLLLDEAADTEPSCCEAYGGHHQPETPNAFCTCPCHVRRVQRDYEPPALVVVDTSEVETEVVE
jgi:hypothetical protein